tara:strand:+ start:3820 stop:4170 length:351 start_codon:yes stop_codon:yes gene_type:complete
MGLGPTATPGLGVQKVQVETDTSLVAILTAAFIYIVSLAWNDAFKNFFTTATPWLKRYGPWAYAVSITVIGFAGIHFLYNNKFVSDVKKTVSKVENSIKNKEEEIEDNKLESFSPY